MVKETLAFQRGLSCPCRCHARPRLSRQAAHGELHHSSERGDASQASEGERRGNLHPAHLRSSQAQGARLGPSLREELRAACRAHGPRPSSVCKIIRRRNLWEVEEEGEFLLLIDPALIDQPVQLFTDETWKKFEGLLGDASAGWLSDPPDVSLYTVLGQDKIGFDILHCSRGSTDVECIHRILRLLYRASQGSPDLADASLAWWRHEHNIKVGLNHHTRRLFLTGSSCRPERGTNSISGTTGISSRGSVTRSTRTLSCSTPSLRLER